MFIRYSTRRVKGKTYKYPQLVEGYRKANGSPTHRVLCSLNSLSEVALANLATALEAGRLGQRVAFAPDAADLLHSAGVLANLRYLDIAVAYEQWHQLQLHSLLADLLSCGQHDVPPQDVVCALVLHRCTDPGSKLAASRWYPKTALPELQNIPPARFQNTRVHRTLEALERVEDDLQARLSQHLRAGHGTFAALFMDITDTWFEGRGPQMAYNARTKEGIHRQKIGVLLLCDKRGYPLRWQTLPGNYYEANAMGIMVQQISTLDWTHQVPIVLDRMMGKAGALELLTESGLRFLTAVPLSEFESWTQDIPWQPLADVIVAGTPDSHKDDLGRVHAALRLTPMVKMSRGRWLLDLGVVTRGDLDPQNADNGRVGVVAQALKLAASMNADLAAGTVRSQAALAKREGTSTRSIRDHLKLTDLAPELQRRVLVGEAETLSLKQLRSVASRPAKRQQAAFEALLKEAVGRRKRLGRPLGRLKSSTQEAQQGPGVSIRLVISFKPDAFLTERRKALETRRELDAFIEDINRRLRSPRSRRPEASIRAEVDRFLRAKNWISLFKVIVDGRETGDFQVKLLCDEEAWSKRRRYDGFSLFAAHPDIPISASDIVETYFAKDAVEKGFQTIKSELELRPVRHRTDPKVRAHVTLCMLALLVERQLELRLREADLPMTASALFDALKPVHLNRLRISSDTTHTVTEPEPDVSALVTALGMQHLVDDGLVLQRITPRVPSVS